MRILAARRPDRPLASRPAARRTQFETLEKREMMAADFLHASLVDASGDTTAETVFADGALRIGYALKLSDREAIQSIGVVATSKEGALEMGTSGSALVPMGGLSPQAENILVDLRDYPKLGPGAYEMQVIAHLASGDTAESEVFDMRILNTSQIDGTYQGEQLDVAGILDAHYHGVVVHGQGGTDALLLGNAMSQIASINGQSLGDFNPLATENLPIHQGYAVDHIVLNNGSEVYFTGIESMSGETSSRIPGASSIELFVTPDDPEFTSQWNLHVSDVPSAWRFTTGSDDVLLVSLDTGVLPESTPEEVYGHLADLTEDRLITDPTDDENLSFVDYKYGHGHMAISVMSSTADNGEYVAGINWGSDVYVVDVYDGSISLQDAIQEALGHAAVNGQKVVFQGGIQGESWLNSGGSQSQLEALLSASEATALYAVAAGNGDVEVDAVPGPGEDRKESGGVARLQASHENVMAVGAMKNHEHEVVQGMTNAAEVRRASYSNYGSGVTLMGATDSLATYQFTGIAEPQFGQENGVRSFGGTSAANPNIAGIASLAWSMNVDLGGSDIREILTDTAMNDLPDFQANVFTGKDFYYGHGLANADLAVRRAFALAVDDALVNIDANPLPKFTRPNYAPSTRPVEHFDLVVNEPWIGQLPENTSERTSPWRPVGEEQVLEGPRLVTTTGQLDLSPTRQLQQDVAVTTRTPEARDDAATADAVFSALDESLLTASGSIR